MCAGTSFDAETNDAKKVRNRAAFLMQLGKHATEVYLHGRPGGEDNETLADVIKRMSTNYVVKRCRPVAIQQFTMCMMKPDETADNFVHRLQALSEHCKFGTALDDRILHQLVIGSNRIDFKDKCMEAWEKETDAEQFTLAKALVIARGLEKRQLNVKGLSQQFETDQPKERGGGNLFYGEQRPPHQSTSTAWGTPTPAGNKPTYCSNCGRAQHQERSHCPAQGQQCRMCGRMHHFERMCRSGGQDRTPMHRKEVSLQLPAIESPSTGTSNNATNSINGISHYASAATQQAGEHIISGTDWAEYLRFKAAIELDIYALTDAESARAARHPRTNLTVLGNRFSVLIDTGAPVNIISERALKAMTPQPAMTPYVHAPYYGFKSKVAVPIIGEFTATATHVETGTATTATFYVVEGDSELLLGYETARALELVWVYDEGTAHNAPIATGERASPTQSQEWPRESLPGTHSEQLGSSECVEDNQSIGPVRYQPRPVAIHLRRAVETSNNCKTSMETPSGSTPTATATSALQHLAQYADKTPSQQDNQILKDTGQEVII